MATIFYTGSSLDGFIAGPGGDLSWLVNRDIDSTTAMGFDAFRPRIGSAVMGASTWQWLLDNGEETFMEGVPTWVLTHREFAPTAGITFTAADDALARRALHTELVAAAGDKDVLLVGGGGLVADFAALDLVDELWVQLAPVTLGAGAPLLPAHVELRLLEVVVNGEFVCTRYAVERATPS